MARYLEWQLDEREPVVARVHERVRGTIDDGQALIWNIEHADGQRMLWHGGGSFGETSQMVLFPDPHFGFVLLANDNAFSLDASCAVEQICRFGFGSTFRIYLALTESSRQR